MQIGFVGLGKMGGNMVHRILRDSDHEVVALDPAQDAIEQAEGHGADGRRLARGPGREAREAAHGVADGPRRATPTAETVEQARRAARRGRHDHRRRQLPAGPTTGRAPRRCAKRGHRLRRRGHERRRLGPRGGLLHDGRRPRRGGRAARRRSSTCSRRRPTAWTRLGHMGPSGAGPLREDGPQRRGVRADAGLRRGLRALRTPPTTSSTYAKIAHLWKQGSVVRSWLLRAGRARVRAGGQRPRRHPRLRGGLRRGPLDGRGRDRQARAGAGDHARAVRALRLAPGRVATRPR